MNVKVKIDERVFEVEVGDVNDRPVVVTVDGERFEVWVETTGEATNAFGAIDKPMHIGPAPVPAANGDGLKAVHAPIPGVVVSIAVKPGDTVTRGRELCVLEAMKMKNAIRATRAGRIASVNVSAGQAVKHHQVLMEYAD